MNLQEIQERAENNRDLLYRLLENEAITENTADLLYTSFDDVDQLVETLQMTADSREDLAAYAHDAWAGWMRHMFEKIAPLITPIDARIITEHPVAVEAYARWHRQMVTPYDELPEYEKESDRAEADKMFAIFIGE